VVKFSYKIKFIIFQCTEKIFSGRGGRGSGFSHPQQGRHPRPHPLSCASAILPWRPMHAGNERIDRLPHGWQHVHHNEQEAPNGPQSHPQPLAAVLQQEGVVLGNGKDAVVVIQDLMNTQRLNFLDTLQSHAVVLA
jgi:hypothetical protein